MSEPGFNTDVNADVDKIEEFIRRFAGSDLITGLLMRGVSRGVGQSLYGTAPSPAGNLPFSSTALFGAQNVGQNLSTALDMQARETVMQSTFDVVNTDRFDKAARLHQSLFGTTEAQAQIQAGNSLNLTTAVANALYGTLQTDELMSGLEMGAVYAGTGSMAGLRGGTFRAQQRTNQGFATISAGIAKSYTDDPESFFGLRGQEVGQVAAEMFRTGGFSANVNAVGDMDPGTDSAEIEKQVSQVRDTIRNASQAVASFRQIFRGDIPQVLDQINTLMGTDVIATFGEGAGDLGRNMMAAGYVSGMTPQQVASLGMMSNQVSTHFGRDPFGAAANATLSAQVLGGSRYVGDFGLMNEQRYRQTVVQRVTGAQESDLSRQISGAYTLLEEQGGDASGFLARINAQEGILSGASVSSALDAVGARGITVSDAMNASYTRGGEVARAGGMGTLATLRSNVSVIETMREQTLRGILQDRGVGNVDAIVGQIQEQGFGVDNIQAVLGNFNLGAGNEAGEIAGAASRNFGIASKALGMGNVFEQDRLLATVRNREMMQRIQERTGTRAQLEAEMGGIGALSGFSRYRKLMGLSGDETFGEIGGLITGKTEMDEGAQAAYAGAFGVGKQILKDIQGSAGEEQTMQQLGVSVAMDAIMNGSINGRAASEKDVEEARTLLSDGSIDKQERMDRLEALGERGNMGQLVNIRSKLRSNQIQLQRIGKESDLDAMRESGMTDAQIVAKHGKDLGGKEMNIIRRQIQMENINKLKERGDLEGFTGKEAEDEQRQFLGRLSLVQNVMRQDRESGQVRDLDQVMENAFDADSNGKLDDKEKANMTEFQGNLGRVRNENDLGGGSGDFVSEAVEAIKDLLQQIVDKPAVNAGPPGGTTDSGKP